jgi:hypothetical protein
MAVQAPAPEVAPPPRLAGRLVRRLVRAAFRGTLPPEDAAAGMTDRTRFKVGMAALAHGGDPWPWLESVIGGSDTFDYDWASGYLGKMRRQLPGPKMARIAAGPARPPLGPALGPAEEAFADWMVGRAESAAALKLRAAEAKFRAAVAVGILRTTAAAARAAEARAAASGADKEAARAALLAPGLTAQVRSLETVLGGIQQRGRTCRAEVRGAALLAKLDAAYLPADLKPLYQDLVARLHSFEGRPPRTWRE